MSIPVPAADQRIADQAADYLGISRGATSPVGAGLRLLHAKLLASRNQMLCPGWADAPRLSARPLEALWTPEERLPYIHVYDCNSAYLSAARNSMMPCGVPELLPVDPARPIDPYAVLRLSDVRGMDDPGLVPARVIGWYTSLVYDQIRSAHGTAVVGTPAWYFPRHHKALTTWADAVWQARLRARAERAEDTERFIKRIAVMTIGYLGKKPAEGQSVHWYYQPQWRGTIIAQHCGKMARLVRRWRTLGATVLGVNDDAIAIGSREPDGYAACPEPDQIGAGLGRLKCVVTLGYGRQQAAHNAISTLSPQRWFQSLEGAAHE